MQIIEPGRYYHIYNRGINSCNLFEESTNYEHFLRLYEKYIHPIAYTYAWCLMKNHFHFLVRIKEETEVDLNDLPNPVRVQNPDRISKKIRQPHLYFSHLSNSYTQAFNKKYKRHGSLFERPFKRILIENELYLKHLVYYIHHNPVSHGFVDNMNEYAWSSYLTIASPKKTNLKRKEVIRWFDDLENLKAFHQQEHDLDRIKHLI
jgi:REP element-mobilizing transposase RayT